MTSFVSRARVPLRHPTRALTRILAMAAVLVVTILGASSGADGQVVHHAQLDSSVRSSSHPCLEGKWKVTKLTLSTTGLTFSGGAGTTVDIMSNGNALGNFTPGAPLVGTEGSAKFNGTITDHYGFPLKTKARSGTFVATPVSNHATITLAGATRPVTTESEHGAYVCTGKDLTLTFTSGASTLKYQMVPAS